MNWLFVCVLLALASVIPGAVGTSRVANGHEAAPHSRPWQAAIYDSAWHVLADQYCSGALVHPSWVVTTATCAEKGMHIGLGYHHKYDDHDDPSTQFIEGIDYFAHPDFNKWSYANDIALVKLATPATLSTTVSVINITSAPAVTGDTLLLSGWGMKSRYGVLSSKVLWEVELTTISDTECIAKYGDLVDDAFCTVAGTNGGGGCRGDEGSPLVSNYNDNHNNTLKDYRTGPLLEGIFSWGSGCGYAKYPDVNVMLSSYCGWINTSTAGDVTCV